MFFFLKRLVKESWAIFGLFALIYVLLFTHRVLMDIPAQMYTLRQVCNGEVAMPPTALFYMLGWLGALGQCQSKIFLGMGAAIACAGLLTARWWITRYISRDYLGSYGREAGGMAFTPSGKAPFTALNQEMEEENRPASNSINIPFGWISLTLAFVCSLPTLDWATKGWYIIGQASPNYWMNGTLLASWPFALVLFWQSYRQLQRPQADWWRWMLLWLVLLVISKPSYAFVFASVYPLFLVGRHGLGLAVRWQLMPFAILALLLVVEFYLIFWQKDSVYVKQFNSGNKSGVEICLLCVWQVFSTNIPVSILASALFPLGVAAVYWQELRQKLLFWYVWAGFMAALVISATFAQTGEEFSCWNFRWQTYIASYLLFMVSALLVYEKIRAENFRLHWRSITVIALFGLHLISGMVYLVKMWWTQSHY